MGDSGLRNLWETAYAHNSVNHMITGHAYARALRAHMHSLSGVNLNKIKSYAAQTCMSPRSSFKRTCPHTAPPNYGRSPAGRSFEQQDRKVMD